MSVAAVEADEPDATGAACTMVAGGIKNEATEGVAAPVAASRCFLLSA